MKNLENGLNNRIFNLFIMNLNVKYIIVIKLIS